MHLFRVSAGVEKSNVRVFKTTKNENYRDTMSNFGICNVVSTKHVGQVDTIFGVDLNLDVDLSCQNHLFDGL